MSRVLPTRPFVLLAFLIASTGAIADTGPALGLQTMCPSIYQPVCGSKSGGSQTFANACLATRAGFIVASQGMCGGGNAGLPRFCTKEYLPVCGERAGKRRVFGNACEARAEAHIVVHQGTC